MSENAVPNGYQAVTPYLIVEEADKLLDFIRDAFGAKERLRMPAEDGTISHAETVIGDSVVMVGGSAEGAVPTRACVHLYLADCDAAYQAALTAGGESVQEPQDQFYGDRTAGVKDPSGTTWWLATRVENLSPEEMRRRAEEAGFQPS